MIVFLEGISNLKKDSSFSTTLALIADDRVNHLKQVKPLTCLAIFIIRAFDL